LPSANSVAPVASFEAAQALEFLSRVPPDVELTVVGGQALNLWAELFAGAPGLAEQGPFASKDLDVLSSKDDLLRVSRQLGAAIIPPGAHKKVLGVSMHGILEVPTSRGPMHVDFLADVNGPTAEEVREDAVPYAQEHGNPIWVMGPPTLVHCRLANVVRVPEKYATDHGLRQLRASIILCRQYFEGLTQSGIPLRRALTDWEAYFALCTSHDATAAFQRHGIELFDAMDPPPSWVPDKTLLHRFPQMADTILRLRKK
jgi:hypothetical protein